MDITKSYNNKRIEVRISFIQILSILICGLLGFLFYQTTTIYSDDMTIQLNPYISVLYGLITGVLISIKH